jgi:hypothetical protein
MASRGFRERILEITTDGTALTNSTTPTSLLDADDKEAFIGAGELEVGYALEFVFTGRISTVVTTPGTLTLDLRMGSTAVFSSGAMTLNTTAQTNVHWVLRGEIICRARGLTTTTTFFPKGCRFISHAVIGSAAPTAGSAGTHMLPYNTAPAVGTGVDFTASQQLDLFATWSVANASNSIQVHTGHIDVYRRT